MKFRDNFKLEETYYKNLKTLMPVINDIRKAEDNKDMKEVLNVLIQCSGAIVQIFRHLIEQWNVLTSFIQKNSDGIKDLDNKVNEYHDELNEKIDEVNNYIMFLIRNLEERIDELGCDCHVFYTEMGEYERAVLVDKNNRRILDAELKAIRADGGIVYVFDRYYGVVYYLEDWGSLETGVEHEPRWVRWAYPVTSGSETNLIGIYWLTWVPAENYLSFSEAFIPTLNE